MPTPEQPEGHITRTYLMRGQRSIFEHVLRQYQKTKMYTDVTTTRLADNQSIAVSGPKDQVNGVHEEIIFFDLNPIPGAKENPNPGALVSEDQAVRDAAQAAMRNIPSREYFQKKNEEAQRPPEPPKAGTPPPPGTQP